MNQLFLVASRNIFNMIDINEEKQGFCSKVSSEQAALITSSIAHRFFFIDGLVEHRGPLSKDPGNVAESPRRPHSTSEMVIMFIGTWRLYH